MPVKLKSFLSTMSVQNRLNAVSSKVAGEKQNEHLSALAANKRPKEESGMLVVKYAPNERLQEVKDILKLKAQRLTDLTEVTQEEYNLRERIIFLMRKEIKFQNEILDGARKAELRFIQELMRDEKDMKLSLSNSRTIEDAVETLNYWFAQHLRVLNLLKYELRKKEDNRLERKTASGQYIEPVEPQLEGEMRRLENETEKKKAKLEVAKSLNGSYLRIINFYNDQSIKFDYRLKLMVKAKSMHERELKDLQDMKTELQSSLRFATKELVKTKRKLSRDEVTRFVGHTELMKQHREEKMALVSVLTDPRESVEGNMSPEVEAEFSLQRLHDTQALFSYENIMNLIKIMTSAKEASEILEVLVQQNDTGEKLVETKWTQSYYRMELQQELQNLKQEERELFRKNYHARYMQLEEKMRQKLLEEEKEKDQMVANLKSHSEILAQIRLEVISICRIVSRFREHILYPIDGKLFDLVSSEHASLPQRMSACGSILVQLQDQLTLEEPDDLSDEVMSCFLFDEKVDLMMQSLFPECAKKAVKITRKSSITVELESEKQELAVMTREEMKRQHKKFSDLMAFRKLTGKK